MLVICVIMRAKISKLFMAAYKVDCRPRNWRVGARVPKAQCQKERISEYTARQTIEGSVGSVLLRTSSSKRPKSNCGAETIGIALAKQDTAFRFHRRTYVLEDENSVRISPIMNDVSKLFRFEQMNTETRFLEHT